MRRLIVLSAIFALAACGQQSGSLTPLSERAALHLGAQASGFRVLYSFKGHPDGAEPGHGPLVVLGDNLYGTTRYGGSSNHGVGTTTAPYSS